MHVIVVGAGEVGQTIAGDLASSHNVVVVEQDPAIVDELTYSLDVLPIQGDGTDLSVLREANIESADMVIAATDDDEANIVVCGAAKAASDAFTIARVRRRNLLETWQTSKGSFGVDFMVCTDLLTAQAIFRISGLPGAHDVDTFANGLVRMSEFELHEGCPVTGQTVQEADRYDSLTFAAVFRSDELLIPDGSTRLQAGDRLVTIGSPESIRLFGEGTVVGDDNGADEVVVFGGTELGHQIARIFAENGLETRLIEQDHDRARELAELLPNVVVMEHDATDTDFLEREHVDEADIVVACFGGDEKNLLVSLLARQLGVDRTVAVAEDPQYADLFETVGVDVAINPQEETAEEIVRFTRDESTEKVAMLEHDRAEVLEIVVQDGSFLDGRQLEAAAGDLPEGLVFGAIAREGRLVTPRGDTTFQAGDHVIVLADSTDLDEILDSL